VAQLAGWHRLASTDFLDFAKQIQQVDVARIIKTHSSSTRLSHHPDQSRRALGFPVPRPASLERINEAAILRYLAAGLVMILLAPGVAIAADPPPADPVLSEATEFPGHAIFAESGAPGMVLVVVRGRVEPGARLWRDRAR
jgi:hypothetical protein